MYANTEDEHRKQPKDQDQAAQAAINEESGMNVRHAKTDCLRTLTRGKPSFFPKNVNGKV